MALVIRHLVVLPRLILSFLAALLVIILLPSATIGDGADSNRMAVASKPTTPPLLMGWDIGRRTLSCFDLLDVHRLRPPYPAGSGAAGRGRSAILYLVIVTAALSLVAILVSLHTTPGHASRATPCCSASPSCCPGPSSTRSSPCIMRMNTMRTAEAPPRAGFSRRSQAGLLGFRLFFFRHRHDAQVSDVW